MSSSSLVRTIFVSMGSNEIALLLFNLFINNKDFEKGGIIFERLLVQDKYNFNFNNEILLPYPT